MEKIYEILFNAIESNKQTVLDAERYIWNNPETGYKEWKTHKFLKSEFEKLGYTVKEVGNIPGFYADIDTGRPGPTVAVFGELDALCIPTHPESNKETGAVHACGHHCQCAGLLGVAIAFKAEGALDSLCGKIRLIAVPAEEAIELEYRQKLIEEGVIHYIGGKVEFMYRGILDDVDIALMVHTSSAKTWKMSCHTGSNGCIIKTAVFKGRSAHAGGNPDYGINALYAANNGMAAANALRETFRDDEHIRFHPIITKGGSIVNAIPDDVHVESYIRGATMNAIIDANNKVNRAFAGAALSMGCELELKDIPGYSPRMNDQNLINTFHEVASMLFDESELDFGNRWGGGCSDMGDINMVIPSIHPFCAGADGAGHSTAYNVPNPYLACVMSAKVQSGTVCKILSNGAEVGKKIIAEKQVVYPSIAEYFKAIDSINAKFDAVKYNNDGTATVKYKK